MYNVFDTEKTGDQRPTAGKRRQTVKFAAFGLCCAVIGGAIGGLGAGAMSGETAAQTENVTTLYAGTRPTVVSMANIDGKRTLSAAEI